MNELIAREMWEYDQVVTLEWQDLISTAMVVMLILILSFLYQGRQSLINPAYKYFTLGLIAKIFGTLVFCSIYLFYYKGGDTMSYFESSMAMTNLFYWDPNKYFEVLFSAPSIETRSLFDDKTGYPYTYMFYDSHTFMVIKLTSLLAILTGKSFFLTSIIISFLSYLGVWKLFLMFREYAPQIEKQLAFTLLYFPSPLFWGGGVSKDTITYMATALFVYNAHKLFILKSKSTANILLLILSSWLILSIKPYIFLVLFPGGLLWIFYEKLTRIKSAFMGVVIFPIMVLGITLLSFYVLSSLSGSMSKFSIERAFHTASVTNYDLKQDYYGGSSFDIGDYDGSISGLYTLFIPAINAGLFRPYIWEGRNIVTLIAGIENLFLLGLTLYVLYKTKVTGAFKVIAKNPLILFCIIFSILFAFMIGLTTSNFGALVRFKIPLIPFYTCGLFMILHYYNVYKKTDIHF